MRTTLNGLLAGLRSFLEAPTDFLSPSFYIYFYNPGRPYFPCKLSFPISKRRRYNSALASNKLSLFIFIL